MYLGEVRRYRFTAADSATSAGTTSTFLFRTGNAAHTADASSRVSSSWTRGCCASWRPRKAYSCLHEWRLTMAARTARLPRLRMENAARPSTVLCWPCCSCRYGIDRRGPSGMMVAQWAWSKRWPPPSSSQRPSKVAWAMLALALLAPSALLDGCNFPEWRRRMPRRRAGLPRRVEAAAARRAERRGIARHRACKRLGAGLLTFLICTEVQRSQPTQSIASPRHGRQRTAPPGGGAGHIAAG